MEKGSTPKPKFDCLMDTKVDKSITAEPIGTKLGRLVSAIIRVLNVGERRKEMGEGAFVICQKDTSVTRMRCGRRNGLNPQEDTRAPSKFKLPALFCML